MPKVSFVKDIPAFEVPSGAVLMESLLKANLPVASSCLGKGVCSKCRVQIVSGGENLSPETDLERGLRERNRIEKGYRISCQSKILGDITIDTGYW